MENLFTLFCVLSSFLPACLPSFSLPSLSLPSCLPPSFPPSSYPSIHPSLLPPSLSITLSFFFLLSVNLDSGIFILHFGLWPKALFKYLFNKFYFFKGSFKFPAKLNKRWTEFSHTLCPHTNIASLTINITHQRGTCIIKMKQQWHMIIIQSPYFTLRIHFWVVHSMNFVKCITEHIYNYSIIWIMSLS